MCAQNAPLPSVSRVVCLWLALFFGSTGCSVKTFQAPSFENSPEIVARVGDATLTKQEFDRVVERSMVRYAAQGRSLPPQIVAHLKESILLQMVDDAIIYERAHKLGIHIDAAEIEAKFAEHKSRFRSEEAFDEYLRRSSNSAAALKDDLRNNILYERVITQLSGAVLVTDEEIEQYYTKNMQNFLEAEQIRARRILLLVPAGAAPRYRRRIEREARRILSWVTTGKREFGAVAKAVGQGPEAAQDGDLGVIASGYLPELDTLIANGLKEGQVSQVIRGRQGLALFRLEQRRAARQRPLEEVKETIRNSLAMRHRNERRQEVLRGLKEEAQVEILINFDVPETPDVEAGNANEAKNLAVRVGG